MPYLIPLSLQWNGETLLVSTPADSITGKNMATTGKARLGLGDTRDVTVIEGSVQSLEMDELSKERANRFATRTGFDPRDLTTPYRWFLITHQWIQAWR